MQERLHRDRQCDNRDGYCMINGRMAYTGWHYSTGPSGPGQAGWDGICFIILVGRTQNSKLGNCLFLTRSA